MGKKKNNNRNVHAGRSRQELYAYKKSVLSSINLEPTVQQDVIDDSIFSPTVNINSKKDSIAQDSENYQRNSVLSPIGNIKSTRNSTLQDSEDCQKDSNFAKSKNWFFENAKFIIVSAFLIGITGWLFTLYVGNNRELGEHKERLSNIDAKLELTDKKVDSVESLVNELDKSNSVANEKLKTLEENLKEIRSDIKSIKNTARNGE